MTSPPTRIALLHGPDQPGLVAQTAHWIFERGGNIIHAEQHRDDAAGVFFQRIEWMPDAENRASARGFREFAKGLGMEVDIARADSRPKIALFVSKISHCFHDLLARWHQGELPAEVACVISNHESLRATADFHGLPFHYIPIEKGKKGEAETAQVEMLHYYGVELVVMARYMQILSEDFLNRCGCPVINIHHSFLPAFAGARPYHQAYARGVKLIGATAHYATAVLDDGPIIEQGVAPVNHRHSVDDLVRLGRDLEKSVLARAVRWHLDHRVLAYANKTVVFG